MQYCNAYNIFIYLYQSQQLMRCTGINTQQEITLIHFRFRYLGQIHMFHLFIYKKSQREW